MNTQQRRQALVIQRADLIERRDRIEQHMRRHLERGGGVPTSKLWTKMNAYHDELDFKIESCDAQLVELTPNPHVVAALGEDWHDEYKARHAIDAETVVVELAFEAVGAGVIFYALHRDLDPELIEIPAIPTDEALAATGFENRREAHFECCRFCDKHVHAAFAPSVNLLFIAVAPE